MVYGHLCSIYWKIHSNVIKGCPYSKTGVHDPKRGYFEKIVYMCVFQRCNLKLSLIGCPCCLYSKTGVHDPKRGYFQKSVYMCVFQRCNLKLSLIGCPCCLYSKTHGIIQNGGIFKGVFICVYSSVAI